MADVQRLTLAFLGSHSVEGARVLETLPAADASALFAELPARIGAPVLAAMLPPAAARALGPLDDEAALSLLAAAGAQAAVAILRHVPEPRRSRLIAALPTLTAVASRILLGFPEDAVGAWADPELIALAPTMQVADALARVRQGEEAGIDHIYVVDAERRLLGRVSLQALLRIAESTALANLVQPAPPAIAAMTPIAKAASLAAWEHAASLPVIDRDQRLIGLMRRATLARALSDRSRRPRQDGEHSVPGVLAFAYWGLVSGLAGTTLALLPPVRRIAPEDT